MEESSREVFVPKDPVDQVIGQEEAVEIARIAAVQRRNLFLVGPPGVGKSLLAQAMASLLPKPTEEISVLDNPRNPERPILEIRKKEEVEREKRPIGKFVDPREVPLFVAERLGYRCRKCGVLSDPDIPVCSSCGSNKYKIHRSSFDDMFHDVWHKEDRVYATQKIGGVQQRVLYERGTANEVIFYDEEALELIEKRAVRKKVIIPLNRNTFVQATGASETELLGDVRHDPYGGHPELGTRPYERVLPGAVHEAHEGVLFIDEISSLGPLQRYILTAMQDKKFPIIGRNPTGSGAAVKVDNIPCDFILVAAINFSDIPSILPPLRSRIIGNGYEVLLNTVMEDNEKNRKKMFQFIAQEIEKDGRIPHMSGKGMERIVEEARKRAWSIDGRRGLTLRFRGLSGLIKLSGDIAISENAEMIEEKHITEALKRAKTAEQQAEGRGNIWRSSTEEYSTRPDSYTI